MSVINKTVSEIKSELKPSKIIAFVVMLVLAGWVIYFLVNKFPQLSKVNKIAVTA